MTVVEGSLGGWLGRGVHGAAGRVRVVRVDVEVGGGAVALRKRANLCGLVR